MIHEGALAHAAAVVTVTLERVVVVAPSESLGGREDSGLLLLVVVTNFTVLAPARLVLALLAVLAAVGPLVVHLVDVIEAARVVLLIGLAHGGGSDNIVLPEVVDVAVLRVEKGLHLLDLGLHGGLGLTSLFL